MQRQPFIIEPWWKTRHWWRDVLPHFTSGPFPDDGCTVLQEDGSRTHPGTFYVLVADACFSYELKLWEARPVRCMIEEGGEEHEVREWALLSAGEQVEVVSNFENTYAHAAEDRVVAWFPKAEKSRMLHLFPSQEEPFPSEGCTLRCKREPEVQDHPDLFYVLTQWRSGSDMMTLQFARPYTWRRQGAKKTRYGWTATTGKTPVAHYENAVQPELWKKVVRWYRIPTAAKRVA